MSYRKCDDCGHKFKIPISLDARLERNSFINVYCPNRFCNSKFSHSITKREYYEVNK